MKRPAHLATARPSLGEAEGYLAVLNALPSPVFALDADNRFIFLNLAAEQFFATSKAILLGHELSLELPSDNPLFSLIDEVRHGTLTASDTQIVLETPRIGRREVAADVASIPECPGWVTVSLHERTIARRINQQLVHRGAARSITALGAILAHEVKNPLSGIRGAAQLLETAVEPNEQHLTRLICDEADRIAGLVENMEAFSGDQPLKRTAFNIHEVLDHTRTLAESGFGKHVHFEESYDPSLPPVLGNKDLLIQAILNLVKNAAEAVGPENGVVRLSTRYQQGVRVSAPGSSTRTNLPLVVGIEDNGGGIPADLRPHLFEPFVTSKPQGKGLGLALVAKIVGDHGGLIEFGSRPRGTIVRLLLPMAG